MELEKQIQKFKFDMMRKMPFYGDILMRLSIVPDSSINTAATNGKIIVYNPMYMKKLSEGQVNYILMHEVFHVLLMHCKRDNNRNHKLWNVACDMVVNCMLNKLKLPMRNCGICFLQPDDGIFCNISYDETVENIYAKLIGLNSGNLHSNRVFINSLASVIPHDDLIIPDVGVNSSLGNHAKNEDVLSDLDSEMVDSYITELIRDSANKNRSTFGSYFVPEFVHEMVQTKTIPWQTLLKEYMNEEISDEVSYTTPERKYLHMDLILPGHSMSEQTLEEVWAFVDSSLSIGKDIMNEFLTQLYRIVKDFKCTLNIVYWDTAVTDIYKNIKSEDEVFKSVPRHSGGTNIDCVYTWIKDNKVKPDIMLVLTDGYFGCVKDKEFLKRFNKKTIVVLRSNIDINNEIKCLGKVTRL